MTREVTARSIRGAAVAVVDDGRVLFQRAYGFANLESETPMTPESIFEIASLTKQFTAAVVMMLVEEGRLRLDDPLSHFVDGTPRAWQRITLRHLLTHASGLDISRCRAWTGRRRFSIGRSRRSTSSCSSRCSPAPGAPSDAGYVLLGLVIEKKVSRRTYREFITERVFTPLEMNDSSLRDKVRVLKGRVATYSLDDGTLVNWRRESDYEVPAAFGIQSTIGNLALWDASLPLHVAQTLEPRADVDAGETGRW